MALDHTPTDMTCAACGRGYQVPAYAVGMDCYARCQPCLNHEVMLTTARWPQNWRVGLSVLHRQLSERSTDPSPVTGDYKLEEVSIKFEMPVFYASSPHQQLIQDTLDRLEADPGEWPMRVAPLLTDVGPFAP